MTAFTFPPLDEDFSAMRVIMGSAERRGAWRVPRHLDVRVILGSADLDLRDAVLSPGLTTIDVSVTLGSVAITVPLGVALEVGLLATLGSVDETTGYDMGDPETSVIRIVGDAMLGSCEIVRAE